MVRGERGNELDGRVGAVADRVGPDLDEALQGVVGHKVLTVQHLHGGRTSVVAVVEPPLNTRPIIGDAGGETHRRLHHVQRYRTPEKAGNCNKQLIPHHLQLSLKQKHKTILQKELNKTKTKTKKNRKLRAEEGEDIRRERNRVKGLMTPAKGTFPDFIFIYLFYYYYILRL